jgi:hypothetical protein
MNHEQKKDLGKKRMKALIAIGTQAAISGGAAAVPTPVVETVKHIAVAGNELLLCANLYQIYYEEKISPESIRELLTYAGILALGAGGLVFVSVKGVQILLHEISNIIWPISTVITVPIATSVTGLVGLTCMLWMDYAYRRDIELGKVKIGQVF